MGREEPLLTQTDTHVAPMRKTRAQPYFNLDDPDVWGPRLLKLRNQWIHEWEVPLP